MLSSSVSWMAFLLVSMTSTTTNKDVCTANHRACSASQIRRAAGSKDPSVLPIALEGWTVPELNEMDGGGKNALHMAAWKGCLEHVKLLVDMGCNVNAISTGEYSYGKTPIFFAATQSRDDVVQYLVSHGNAHVKIINNKGQSVLSIASSHLTRETIRMIQQAEERQAHLEWRNYRETHSDHFEYGDCDPRFLERPLSTSDVVTPLAINPTTKESRRGAFARRNPQATLRIKRDETNKSATRKNTDSCSADGGATPATATCVGIDGIVHRPKRL